MSRNLFSLFEAVAIGAGGNQLINSPDAAPWPKTAFSYQDMLSRTAQFANLFNAEGVKPGDRIAAQTDKSPDALFAYLAALRVGAVYLPLNPAYTDKETLYALEDAAPRLFLCRPEARARVEPIADAAGVASLLTLSASGDDEAETRASNCPSTFQTISRTESDLAAILYTSGTTGRPKGAMLSHGNLRSNCEALVDIWRFTADDILIHALPIFHVHGLFVATNVCLAAGARMLFLPRFDADEILNVMSEATALMGVPTFYTRLLETESLTRTSARAMRVFISGSAPLSAETHKLFRERTGHAILERYGMTETGMIASNPYEGERLPGAVGFPLPGVEVRIASDDCDDSGADGVGVIEVHGPNVFRGYWNRHETTAKEFTEDGYFITGDLGRFDEQGYLHIAGRAKDLIISGGLNVYPAEVEATLDRLPGVQESAIIGAPHRDLGEGVVAIIVRDVKQAPTSEEITKALRHELAGYKVPKTIFFEEALPRNVMGKVQKNALRARYKDVFKTA